MYHLYFVWVITTTLTAAQKQKVREALHAIEEWRNNDPNPANNVQVRERLDGQAWLIEFTSEAKPTKARVVQALAQALGIAQSTLSTNSTFIPLAFTQDREASAAAARQHIADNVSAWETAA